jgi:hypothetical protein
MVHAAWDGGAVTQVASIRRLDTNTLREMTRKGTSLHRAKETLLNGPEARLPEGHFFEDKSGLPRRDIRLRWWMDLAGRSYRDAAFPAAYNAPELPLPPELVGGHAAYPTDAPPVFIGHYWLPDDDARQPIAPNIACLDYSVAKRGRLTAYRWEGESLLDAQKYVLHK